MFLKSLLLIFIGICSGLGIAAGTFAFLVVLRVIPRMVQMAKLEHKNFIWNCIIPIFMEKKVAVYTIGENASYDIWHICRNIRRVSCCCIGRNIRCVSDFLSKTSFRREIWRIFSVYHGTWKNDWKSVLFSYRIWYNRSIRNGG